VQSQSSRLTRAWTRRPAVAEERGKPKRAVEAAEAPEVRLEAEPGQGREG